MLTAKLRKFFCYRQYSIELVQKQILSINKNTDVLSDKLFDDRQPKFQAVVFDKDGTLICFHSMWTPWITNLVKNINKELNKDISSAIYSILGVCSKTFKTSQGIMAEGTKDQIKDALKTVIMAECLISEDESMRIIDKYFENNANFGNSLKEIHDVRKLFKVIKQHGVKIGICTSDSREDNNSLMINPRNFANDSQRKFISTYKANKKQNLLATFNNWIEYETFENQFSILYCKLNSYINPIFSTGKYVVAILPNRQFHKSSCLHSTIKTDPDRKYYDYIIIGAGSAGCVLANRLSANKNNSVNLLEAGSVDNALTIKIPGFMMFNLRNDKFNWYYNTKPQQYLNGRSLYCPIGRGIGGSSSLNAMIYTRGHPYDYDRWEKEGATGWSYASCLPYFKKSQNHELGENLYRGGNGLLHVERTKVINELHHLWINAGIQAGHSLTDDMNGYQQEGIGEFDCTTHNGERWSAAKAFLKPAMNNNNLKVTTGVLVTKILFEGKRAIGVEVLNNRKQLEKIMTNKEVILCGGSIKSPQLLMLSGVGDGNQLKTQSIKVVEHVPNVGKNLQDHLVAAIQHRCKKPISLYKPLWKFPFSVMKIGVEWSLFRSGIGTTSHINSGGFIRSESNVLHPDIQFHFIPVIVIDHGRDLPTFHSFQTYAGNLRTQSRGQITLQSNDPRKYPIIDPNYCSKDRDFFEIIRAIRECRKIFSQQSFESVIGEEIAPGKEIQSDSQLSEFIKQTGSTIYHPTSTCRMGSSNDNSTVVDPECRVLGIDNLRVVDASIMPSLISGNTNAPVIMIAEKAADIILGNPPLPKIENVPVWKHV